MNVATSPNVVTIKRREPATALPKYEQKATILIFPLAAQASIVRRTAEDLVFESDDRRNLTFSLWREGLNRQARRFGRSKAEATLRWEAFKRAVCSEIDRHGIMEKAGCAIFAVGDQVVLDTGEKMVIVAIDCQFAWVYGQRDGYESVELSSLRFAHIASSSTDEEQC